MPYIRKITRRVLKEGRLNKTVERVPIEAKKASDKVTSVQSSVTSATIEGIYKSSDGLFVMVFG